MNLQRFIKTQGFDCAAGLFSVCGSFGHFDGLSEYTETKRQNGVSYCVKNDVVKAVSDFTFLDNGAVLRKDYIVNLTNKEIFANRLFSRFVFEGGEYDVYSQTNSWQHECVGRWQPLSSSSVIESQGVRTCDGATPLMALYNKQNNRTLVFHLFPNCQWKMSATRRVHTGLRDTVVVETGILDSGLNLKIMPGETIYYPEIFFYETHDKVGLGAEKLHEYMGKEYPRKSLPLIYNTWLMCFDVIDYDLIVKQVDAASELGFEYFVVDAGWFGKGDSLWVNCVGDWEENLTGAFYGKMQRLSQYVNEKGMKFGLWVEPERATEKSEAYKNHPEQFFSNYYLLDFSNEHAVKRMIKVVDGLIKKYNLGFIKFDFNRTVAYDYSGNSFYRYMQGQKLFVESIRKLHPDIYLCNCASGGNRIDLEQSKIFDSFWISDNQGPVDGLRIYTDMIKRIHPSVIEKWNVQTLLKNIPAVADGSREKLKKELMVSCNNADWTSIVRVDESYTFNFLSGGPIGYSCDIAAFPAWYKKQTKAFFDDYKKTREYFISANIKVLCNTENLVVYEYFDENYKNIIIKFFTKLSYQEQLTVFPIVDVNADYVLADKVISGIIIAEDGITFNDLKDFHCIQMKLNKRVTQT